MLFPRTLVLLSSLALTGGFVLADISDQYNNYHNGNTTCGLTPLNCRQNSSSVRWSKPKPAPYIINGQTVEYGEWPFVVKIHINQSKCTGVLVGSDLVLTAAHCTRSLGLARPGHRNELDGKIPAYVYVGKISNDEKDAHEVRHDIRFVQCGAYYYTRGFLESNPDFARLWLREPVKFNDYVQPVCIPSRPAVIYDLAECASFVIGFGLLDKRAALVRAKKAQWITMEQDLECPECMIYNSEENRTARAFQSDDFTNRQICDGDSGAPLVALDDNGRWSLIGIAIQSPLDCNSKEHRPPSNAFILMAKIVDILDENFRLPIEDALYDPY